MNEDSHPQDFEGAGEPRPAGRPQAYNHEASAPQSAPAWCPPSPPPPRRRSIVGRVFRTLLAGVLVLSVLMNVYLLGMLGLHLAGPLERKVVREGQSDQTVALYELQGVIDSSAAEHFRRFYLAVREDPNVRAVVLRVDSPGGSVASSDQIHAMVEALAADPGRPLLVSMGGVAASGGYYVSAPALEIFAERTTVTGSIGVLMAWMNVSGTLEKIGMDMEVMKSSDARGWKDAPSSFSRLDPRQREYLQEILDKMQDRFNEVVRRGRGERLKTETRRYQMRVETDEGERTVEQTDTVPLNGKVFLAADALDWGLIDRIGYLDAAIDRAAELSGLDSPHVVRYSVRLGLMEKLGGAGPAAEALDRPLEVLQQLRTPRLLMLWQAE